MRAAGQFSYDEGNLENATALFTFSRGSLGDCKFRVDRHASDHAVLYFVAWSDTRFRMTVPHGFSLWKIESSNGTASRVNAYDAVFNMLYIHDYELRWLDETVWRMTDNRSREMTVSDKVSHVIPSEFNGC